MPMVQAQGVHKYFHHLHVLRGVDLDVERKEVVVHPGGERIGKDYLSAVHQSPGEDR
jgi:polar amino acid transport system ATP-binding protein